MTREATISRSVLSDQVKDRLLQSILDGRYPPGARIVETRVARELGTSQAPVREALRDLEALGVVETAAFRGARVRRPSADELLEAFVIRAELESLGARLAIPRLTDGDLEVLAGYVGEIGLADLAVLLEDAIDMHDRHWKIHWMLNFAQLSATLNLRAVMEKTHGKIDEVLLGRLQNSGNDRNWDKIGALWEMKEEVKGDAELAQAFAGLTAADIIPVLQSSERGRRFIDERVVPYQKEFGWHAVWSHEFVFPSFREDMTPVIQLIRDQYSSDYDFPSKVAALRADIDAAARQILEGLEGEALEEMRSANEINLKIGRSPRITTSTSTRAPTPTSASC